MNRKVTRKEGGEQKGEDELKLESKAKGKGAKGKGAKGRGKVKRASKRKRLIPTPAEEQSKRPNVYNEFRKDERVRAALKNKPGSFKDKTKLLAEWYKKWKTYGQDWTKFLHDVGGLPTEQKPEKKTAGSGQVTMSSDDLQRLIESSKTPAPLPPPPQTAGRFLPWYSPV